MAERATMTALIDLVLVKVADPTSAVISRVHAQDILDQYRTVYRMFPLTASVDVAPTSAAYEWRHYYPGGAGGATIPWWETDAILQSNTYADITTAAGTTIDYLTGEITFAATYFPPVWWTGKAYDVFAAAADLCDERAALTSDQYNYSDQGQSLSRGMVPVNWEARARAYRRQARPITGLLLRSDSGVWA